MPLTTHVLPLLTETNRSQECKGVLPYIDLLQPLSLSSIYPGDYLRSNRRQIQREGLSASDTLSSIRDNNRLYRFHGNLEAYGSHDPFYVCRISDAELRQLTLEDTMSSQAPIYTFFTDTRAQAVYLASLY
jgi:hypothetical protein